MKKVCLKYKHELQFESEMKFYGFKENRKIY